MKKVILLFITACLISCGPPANEPPDVNANTSSQLFLELWEIFDREYAFFDVRQVDWDAKKMSGQEKARSATNDSLLLRRLRETTNRQPGIGKRKHCF